MVPQDKALVVEVLARDPPTFLRLLGWETTNKQQMSKNKRMNQEIVREDRMEMQGEVAEAMGGTLFKIKCESHEVIASLSGRLRQNQIRILPGDKVLIEVSPYDMSRGRIVRRL